ncbi:MAG: hypothetical protein MI924_05000, partial [Chloroflexales bacterium]|nr:hypothetical protein [Chloroflexales bacterium]
DSGSAMLAGLAALSRMIIGFVFAISFAQKIVAIAPFIQAIAAFKLIPARLSRIAAVFVVGAEGTVVLLLIIGERWLGIGFILASLLLLGFSGALATVLIRRIPTRCNCFGPRSNVVTSTDLWRNGGLLVCALGGWAALGSVENMPETLPLAAWVLISLTAGLLVAVWLQLGEIVQLFRLN